jgi:hypothetical protein
MDVTDATRRRLLDPEWFGFAPGGPRFAGLFAPAATPVPDGAPTAGEPKMHRAETLAVRPPRPPPTGASPPPASPLDPGRWTPADWMLLRFGSRAAALRFAGFVERCRTATEDWTGPGRLPEGLSELLTGSFVLPLADLPPAAVSEPAVIAADLNTVGGGDLTLLLPVLDRAVFEAALAKSPGRPSPAETGIALHRHLRPDGSAALYSASLADGKVWALSFSAGALRRIGALAERPEASLAADRGYRARPHPALDDGLLYVSDACMDRLTGPRRIVGDLRRRQCLSNLRRLTYEQLYHFMMHGRFADAVEALAGPVPPVCPHGGRYRLGPDRAPQCTLHGSPDRPAPLVDLPDDLITEREARAYERVAEDLRDRFPLGPAAIAAAISTRPTVRFDFTLLPAPEREPVLAAINYLPGLLDRRVWDRPPNDRPMVTWSPDRLPADAVAAAAFSLPQPIRGAEDPQALFAAAESLLAGKTAILELYDCPVPAEAAFGPEVFLRSGRWAVRVGDLPRLTLERAAVQLRAGYGSLPGVTVSDMPAAGGRPDCIRVRGHPAVGGGAMYLAGTGNDTLVLAGSPELIVPRPAARAGREPAAVLTGQIGLSIRPDRMPQLQTYLLSRLGPAAAWLCAGRQAGCDALARAAGFHPATVAGWAERALGARPRCAWGTDYAAEVGGPCRCPVHDALNAISPTTVPPARDPARLPTAVLSVDLAASLRPDGPALTVQFDGPEPRAPRPPAAPRSDVPARLRLEEARRMSGLGRTGAALDELQTLLWLYPRAAEAADARRMMVRIREEQGRPEVDALLERIRVKRLDLEQVRSELEAIIHDYEGGSAAELAGAELVRLKARSAGELYCLAQAAAAESDFDQALTLLDVLVRRMPSSAEAGEPARQAARQWWPARGQRDWAALVRRIEDEALAPQEARPRIRDFVKLYAGTPAAAHAAELDKRLAAATPADLLDRARAAAAAGNVDRAVLLAGKVRRFHPGAPEADAADKAEDGWLRERVERETAAILAEHKAGRIDHAEAANRLAAAAQQAERPGPAQAVAAARRTLDLTESAARLGKARSAAAAERWSDAVDAACRLIDEFPGTPAALEAAGLRRQWWQAWCGPDLRAAEQAAREQRLDAALRVLEGVGTRAGFPEARRELAAVRGRIIGDDNAATAWAAVLELRAAPRTPPEQIEDALRRLAADFPKAPIGAHAAAELDRVRAAEADRLLRTARQSFSGDERDRLLGGDQLKRIRDRYADTPAGKSAAEFAARLLEQEAAGLAARFAEGNLAEANARMNELRKNRGFAPEPLTGLDRTVKAMNDIYLAQQSVPLRGPGEVRRRLQQFIDEQPADAFRRTAIGWAEKWKHPIRATAK